MVEAADLFNASAYRRTIAGIAKSLGMPKVSIVPLSGVNTEVVITVAWDISWYQYRVTVDSAQPVRLEERGLELSEVDAHVPGVEREPRPARAPDARDRARLGAHELGSAPYNRWRMIYCVIPPELEDELFDRLTEYYKDNPNVTVIIDRRDGPGPPAGKEPTEEEQEQRELRDRRRRRAGHVPGHRRP